MKTLTFVLCILFIIVFNTFSQFNNGAELFFYNESNQNVIVRIHPISSVFNNDHDDYTTGYYGNYNLVMTNRPQNDAHTKDYVSGVSYNRNLDRLDRYFTIPPSYPNNQNAKISFGFDDFGGSDQSTAGTIGFGIYRVEFFWTCTDPEDIYDPPYCLPDDYFTIEYDFGYVNNNRNIAGCQGQAADVNFRFINEISGHPRIQYLWKTCECVQSTSYQDIPQNRTLYERDRGCTGQSWTKELGPVGGFKYNNGRNPSALNPYNVMPLDPRYYCDITWFPQAYATNENHIFFNDGIGILILNLTIEKNVTTSLVPWSVEFPSFPPITITNGATLKLTKGVNNQERTFTFKKYTDYNQGTDLYITTGSSFQLEASTDAGTRSHVYFQDYCDAEVDAEGWIDMGYNSIITLQNNSTMYWFPNSQISGEGNAKIEINTGAELHNCNAHIYAPLNIHQNGGQYIIHNPQTCYTANAPQEITQTVEDGSSIEIFDGGILTVEENCTLVFDGEDSYLKAGPGTIVQLGEGVTIEFINGAYLDADGCTFTSINSGEIWQGIVLDEAGSQTNIRNCTFNDAAASIEVSNSV